MSGIDITIEGIGPEVLAAYAASGMDRGQAGASAISWTFAGNDAAFAVARKAGAVVGVSAYIRSRMQFGSRHGLGYQAVDSFVSETMRGQGVFTKLARAYDTHAAATGADLVWGFPNDNAAPAWFGKLNWHSHGQVPFLVKPLRAGYFLRKFGLPGDFPLSLTRDMHVAPIASFGDWADAMWDRVAPTIGCGTIRDRGFLTHRVFDSPQRADYRTVADPDPAGGAVVVTREAEKHGGRIAYVMEALGLGRLPELLASELGRMRARGVEVALAWAFPWSPNYRALRRCGFVPLPVRLRPIHIWFGTRPHTAPAAVADRSGQWYLSYLDSDTI